MIYSKYRKERKKEEKKERKRERGKQKPWEFITIRLVIEEMPKEVLQVEITKNM
jgi:hypothetical protein